MNPYVLLLLTILSIGTLYIAPNVIVQAHADRIGEICIAPHGSTSCPPTVPTIPGPLPAAGKSFFFLDIPSLNGFGGTNGLNVDLTTSVSAIGSLSPLPLFSVSPTSVTVAVGSDGLSGMNITVPASTPPGMYVLNITGTSSGVPPNSVTLQLIVPIPDFNIAPSPPHVYLNVTATSPSPFVPSGFLNHTAILAVNVVDYVLSIRITGVLTVLQGSSEIQPVTLAATDIYNVTVSITSVYVAEITPVKIITSNGINVACSPNPVMIISRNNASLHVVGVAATDCNVQGITVGNYIVTVVSTSGAQNRTSIHSISFQVSVIAPSFSIILPSTVPTIPVGSSATIPATYAGNNGLKDNISASVFISSNGLSPLPTISGNGTIVSVTQTSPNATISFTISASSTTPPGTYILRIHGDGVKSIPGHFDVTIPIVVVAVSSPHDLAVVSVSPSTTMTSVGSDISIVIEVQNVGRLTDNATITAIVSDQTIGTQNVTLAPGQNVNETFTWHTTGFSPGAYMIGGKVLAVAGETNTSNNLWRYATPVTLNPANTSILNNAYTVPIIIIGVIIVAAIAMGLFLLPRRRSVPVR